MEAVKFKLNRINLEFLINEAWKTKKSIAIKYKGTLFENYIELVEDDDKNLLSDICVRSDSFETKDSFTNFIEKYVR